MDYITLALAKDYADQVAAGGGGSVDLKNYYNKRNKWFNYFKNDFFEFLFNFILRFFL